MSRARYKVVVIHGESDSLFHVVDTLAPEDDQPAIIASPRTRADADRVCQFENNVIPLRPTVPFVDTCIEHGPGGTLRLPFQIRVF